MKKLQKSILEIRKTKKVSNFFSPPIQSFKPRLLKEEKIDIEDQILEQYKDQDAHIFNDKTLQIIITILKIPAHLRRQKELIFMSKILKKEHFFREFKWKNPKEVYSNMLLEFRHEHFPKFKVIANFGEIQKKFRLILEGEIFLLKPKNKEARENISEKIQTIPFHYKRRDGVIEYIQYTKDSQQMLKLYKDSEILEKCFPDFYVEKNLRKGDYFGNPDKNIISGEILIAKENTHCLSFNIDAYQKILADNEKDFTEKSFSFFNSIPLLASVPFYVIRDLNRYFEEKKYFAGTTVYDFNDTSEYLYIIINGEIEIKEYLKTYDKVDDYLSNQNISSLKEAEQMNKTLQKISKNEMNFIFNEKKEKETKEKYSLYSVAAKQIFGDLEILNSSLLSDLDAYMNQDLSLKKRKSTMNPNKREFLNLLCNLIKEKRRTQAKTILETNLYRIPWRKFLEIYLNYFHTTAFLKKIKEKKNEWLDDRREALVQSTKRNINEFYELIHRKKDEEDELEITRAKIKRNASFHNEKGKKKERDRPKSMHLGQKSRFSLDVNHLKIPDLTIDCKISDIVRNQEASLQLFNTSKPILLDRRTDEIFSKNNNMELSETKNSSIIKQTTSKKYKTFYGNFLNFNEELRSKSEERIIRTSLFKIEKLRERSEKKGNKQVIDNGIKIEEGKENMKRLFLKRMRIDQIFEEKRREINSAFEKKEERGWKEIKLTSFQTYVKEKKFLRKLLRSR